MASKLRRTLAALAAVLALAAPLAWAQVSNPTPPGGTSGQPQYNNSGSFGGFTMGGDCTLSQPTITCTKTNGALFVATATSNALSALATQANDSVVMNATGGSAAPTAVSLPVCTLGADLYNTTTHAWSCVSVGGNSYTVTHSGNVTAAAWNETGIGDVNAAFTATDSSTAGSGTAATNDFHTFAIPTLAASNTLVTTTNSATVSILGPPSAGTNETLTSKSALKIKAGNVDLWSNASLMEFFNVGSPGANNTELGTISWASNQFQIQTNKTGTGTQRSMFLQSFANIILDVDTGGATSIQLEAGGITKFSLTGNVFGGSAGNSPGMRGDLNSSQTQPLLYASQGDLLAGFTNASVSGAVGINADIGGSIALVNFMPTAPTIKFNPVNFTVAAWTTNGVGITQSATTYTDSSSSGTVATEYINKINIGTVATSNAGVTFTDNYALWIEPPTAGTNVTMTNKWALGLNGALKVVSATVNLPSLTTGTNADTVCYAAGGNLLIQASTCTISSKRFKVPLGPLAEDALAAVAKLPVVKFKIKPDSRQRDPNAKLARAGLYAEDVAKAMPLCAVYENDLGTPKSYDDKCVIGYLIKGEQQLLARVSALEAQNARLRHALAGR